MSAAATTLLIDVALYTPWDAARYLRVPGWFVGAAGEPPDEATEARLSFRELATLFVHAAAFDLPADQRPRTGDGELDFRRPAGELADELASSRTPHPHHGRLRELFARRLSAVEVVNGQPARLFPPTRDPSAGSPRLIVLDPQVRFGRPTVARTGTPTDAVFERYQAGDSVANLADDYDLTTDEVEESIRYEAMPHPVPTRHPVR